MSCCPDGSVICIHGLQLFCKHSDVDLLTVRAISHLIQRLQQHRTLTVCYGLKGIPAAPPVLASGAAQEALPAQLLAGLPRPPQHIQVCSCFLILR